MTIEQSTLPSATKPPGRPNPEHSDYAKIKEVTGVEDNQLIAKAIESCSNNKGRYELDEVISALLSENIEKPEPKPSQPVTVSSQTPNNKKGEGDAPTGQNVVDLTGDQSGSSDLQKAIAASLQDANTPAGIFGGQVSREDQDISKALEASLLDKPANKRKRGDLWFIDPLNPHERKRQGAWPVGLKNVGNTCWFSAVIQSLFHLPVFRRLVLNYRAPVQDESTTNVKRNLQFMSELRRLFALMVGSRKKYVDPSKAVEILKEAFSAGQSAVDSQQDVSEFQHKLLDWLEDAFSMNKDNKGSDSETRSSNPMVKLFYGTVQSEGRNNGHRFSKEETFGQFPLQVEGYPDIHASLEAATAQSGNDGGTLSNPEQWFSKLPPLLTFELSRFQFNQDLGRPEKIHQTLDFPLRLHMDRYLSLNKEITRRKREELNEVRKHLCDKQAKLDKFVNYGSGAKRFPLQDVLQYALEFAESNPSPRRHRTKISCSSPGTTTVACNLSMEDVEMASPKSQVSMQTDSPVPSPGGRLCVNPAAKLNTPLGLPGGATDAQPDTVCDTDTAMVTTDDEATTSQVKSDESPSPRHVDSKELEVLQGCLRRWRTEVEADVCRLQSEIASLENTVSEMFEEDSLHQHAYELHAVLVHEGQAASGHYWAYVKSAQENSWLKFNDITVTQASWKEIKREGTGGFHNASAYCLMYVNPQMLADMRGDFPEEVPPISSAASGARVEEETTALMEDLIQYVDSDNRAFQLEISQWDSEMKQKQQSSVDVATETAAASGDVNGSGLVTQRSGTKALQSDHCLAMDHARISSQETLQAANKAILSDTFKNKGPVAALNEALHCELKRLEHISRNIPTTSSYRNDARLSHQVAYLLANGVSLESKVLLRLMMEQFAFMPNPQKNIGLSQLQQTSAEAMKDQTRQASKDEEQEYQEWHELYQQFRRATQLFLTGAEYFNAEKYQDSLLYLNCACDVNNVLVKDGHLQRALDVKLLHYYRRQSLLHLNEVCLTHFEQGEKIEVCIKTVQQYILPSLPVLTTGSGFADDQSAVDDIRNRWCALLGRDLGAISIHLQDLIAQLIDPPIGVKLIYPSYLTQSSELSHQSLSDWFSRVIQQAETNGDLENVRKSK